MKNGMDEWQERINAEMSGPPHPDSRAALRAEIERLLAALVQVEGFAHVMNERNWRDLKTHISRQCDVLRPYQQSTASKPDPL